MVANSGMDLAPGSLDTDRGAIIRKEVIQMSSEILAISVQPLDLNRPAGEAS